jgi:hypothetical protein
VKVKHRSTGAPRQPAEPEPEELRVIDNFTRLRAGFLGNRMRDLKEIIEERGDAQVTPLTELFTFRPTLCFSCGLEAPPEELRLCWDLFIRCIDRDACQKRQFPQEEKKTVKDDTPTKKTAPAKRKVKVKHKTKG